MPFFIPLSAAFPTVVYTLRHELMGYVQHLQHEQERGAESFTEALHRQRDWLESQLQHLATSREHELAQRQAAETDLVDMLRGLEAVVGVLQTTQLQMAQDQQASLTQAMRQQQTLEHRLHRQSDEYDQMQQHVQLLTDQLRQEVSQRQAADLRVQQVMDQLLGWQKQQRHLLIQRSSQRRRSH